MRKPMSMGYEGKYDQFIEDGNGGGTAIWQPGDGTRYTLIARTLTEAEQEALGAKFCSMVTVSAHGSFVTLLLEDGALHHASYLCEKFRPFGLSSDGLLLPLIALINLAVGDEEYGRGIFDHYQGLRKA